MKAIKLQSLFLLLCMLVIFSGCATQLEIPEESLATTGIQQNPTVGLTAENIDLPAEGWCLPEASVTHPGTFGVGGYYNEIDSVLTFTDLSNGTNVVLCSKPGCLHYDEPDAKKLNCDAYIGIMSCCYYQEDKIFYVAYQQGSDDNGLWLIQRKADGTGEEKIGRLASEYITKDTSISVTQFVFAGSMLYYRADIIKHVQTDGITTQKNSEWLLMRMDLNSGEDELLEEYKLTEAPLLLGAQGDMLLYYTIPVLTEEEQATNPNLMLEKPTKLKVWTDSIEQSVTLFSYEYKVFGGGGYLIGGKYYYRYYDNREAGESHYKTYDLVTRQHENANFLNPPVINGRYAIHSDGDTSYEYLYDTITRRPLPMDYNDIDLSVFKANKDGVILRINQHTRNENEVEIVVNKEYRYIPYSELEDGLQKTDGILMPLM